MALGAALALAGCAGPPPFANSPLFVDQIDEGRAVLIDAHGQVHRWPAAWLPPDAGEGAWVGGAPDPAFEARVASLRQALARDDDGGDLTLR